MSQYKLLQLGSTGQEVMDMKSKLSAEGFLDAGQINDQYDSTTEAAVKKYQEKYDLLIDGKAGDETLGHLYSKTQSGTDSAQTNGTAAGDTGAAVDPQKQYYYDSSSNEAYLQAQALLQEQLGKMPQIQGSYDQQIADIVASITGREEFNYNINEDALYQQYKDQYTRQGQLAMMDAMGQAAALGGGYGSTYAQSVGQQQYQAYLQQLNAVVPELYNTAKAQYDQEGDELLEQYSLYRDMADSELNRQQTEWNNWWQNVSFLQGQADDAYSRGYTEWYNAQQMQKQDEATAYERQQTANANLVNMITGTGYDPTDEELSAAGMTREQANAYKNYYNASKVSYGGSGTGPQFNMGDYNDTLNEAKGWFEFGGAEAVESYLFGMRSYMDENTIGSIYRTITGSPWPYFEDETPGGSKVDPKTGVHKYGFDKTVALK